MKKVKFLRNESYKQNAPEQSREYKAGETYDLDDDHALRWLRRGSAVEVKPEPKPEHKPEPRRAQAMVPHAPEKG